MGSVYVSLSFAEKSDGERIMYLLTVVALLLVVNSINSFLTTD